MPCFEQNKQETLFLSTKKDQQPAVTVTTTMNTVPVQSGFAQASPPPGYAATGTKNYFSPPGYPITGHSNVPETKDS
ncbi:unnamed protein product [Clavelina lepadiformis]|uniref:Uncharacterized protein n=1 Tax=Clavelina lepadiformis TaxID=159417 RepID=A0ABP0F190_CLALP